MSTNEKNDAINEKNDAIEEGFNLLVRINKEIAMTEAFLFDLDNVRQEVAAGLKQFFACLLKEEKYPLEILRINSEIRWLKELSIQDKEESYLEAVVNVLGIKEK